MPPDPDAADAAQIEELFAAVLRDNLYDGLEQVVIEPYNGPRPSGPYASVRLVDARPEQHEVFDYDDRDDGYHEALRGEHYCRARLTFFNAGAMRLAVACQNLLRSTNRLFDLTPFVGFGAVGEAEDASETVDAKTEERAVLAVEFYANLAAEYPSNSIAAVRGDIVREGGEPLPYAVNSEE